MVEEKMIKNYKVLVKDNNKDKTIVWVHGAGCTGDIFKPLADKLENFNHVMVNLPGRREVVSDFDKSVEGCRDFIFEIGKEIKGYKILIGHSLGATIAINARLVDKNSEIYDKYIGIAGVISADFISDEVLNIMSNDEDFNRVVGVETNSFLEEDKAKLPEYLKDSLVNSNVRTSDFILAKGYNGLKYVEKDSKYELLCISGTVDGVVDIDEQLRIKDSIPGSDLCVIPGRGHFVICQESELGTLADIITDYIL